MDTLFGFGRSSNNENAKTDRSLQEQVEALTVVNAKLQSEIYELKQFVRNLAETILPSLRPNDAVIVRDALNKNGFQVYRW